MRTVDLFCLALLCFCISAFAQPLPLFYNGTPEPFSTNIDKAFVEIRALVLTSDEKTLYCSDFGARSVWVIDVQSGTGNALIPAWGLGPSGLAWGDSEQILFVGDQMNNHVYEVQLNGTIEGTMRQVDVGSYFTDVSDIAYDGAGTIYVVDQQLNSVAAVDVKTGVVTPIAQVSTPFGIAISPPKAAVPPFLITASWSYNQVTFMDLATKKTTLLNVNTSQPCTVTMSPDGLTAFITDPPRNQVQGMYNFIPSLPNFNPSVYNVTQVNTVWDAEGFVLGSSGKLGFAGCNSAYHNIGLVKLVFGDPSPIPHQLISLE